MAVQDYYFALQNLSRSNKIFGFYSGSATFDYNFNYNTGSNNLSTYDIILNSGSLGSGGTTNESQTDFIYLDDKTLNQGESVISYLTKLDDLNNKGQIKIEVSGSSSYNLIFNIDGVEVGPSVSSMILTASFSSSNSPTGDPNNPISSSISSSGGGDLTPKLITTFTGTDLRGYHETDVTGSSTKYIVASSGSFTTSSGQPSTGSLPAPFAIDWGIPESTFIGENYYPSSPGYTWLWNDGYKVKHIKMNNISSTGDILNDFIKHSEWARFVMYNPVNATGSYIHDGDGHYAEDYQLYNVTKYNSQNYSHLFVNQESKDTSFATDTNTPGNITDTFRATGDYIVYASSSGTVIEPTLTTGIDKSIPQGYFPSSSTSYPTEQSFRGWAGANYYVNGILVSVNGTLDDPLQAFNSGSTERDKDGEAIYIPSTPPFFIDASASYVAVQSSSFIEFANQTNLTKIGPSFTTSGGNEVIYYYKEDTNQIIIRGAEYLDTQKTTNIDFDPLRSVELININASPVTYNTPEGFNIEVKESQSLWLYRGLANIGTGNGDLYNYNRFLHRPFKTYIVTSTGSIEAGYGEQNYASGSYGSGSQPVGPPANEFETVYIAYSSSVSSDRPNDGLYTFDTKPLEELQVTASVDFGYTSIDVIRSSSYGTGSYGENEFEYGGTGSGDDVNTWQSATLKLYKNNTVISSDTTSINSTNILYGLTSTLQTTLQPYEIGIGDTLKLAVEVSNESSNFNSSLIVNNYTMSFGNLVYPSQDLVPVTFNNYLELNDDCNPTDNNVFEQRPNERLQDVDYSVDINSPINFEQIIKDEAVRATVPESNYTQNGFADSRYSGSRSVTSRYNVFTAGDIGTFGRVSNIDINKAYFAYFDKIYDLYPIIEGTTTLNIKYVFDAAGNRFNPRLGDFNFFNLEGTFEPQSTLVLSNNAKEDETLQYLNTNHIVRSVGIIPTPILYTQIGGEEATGSISFTGFQPPQPDPPTFNNYTFTATGSVFPSQNTGFGGASLSDKGTMDQLSPDSGISGSETNVTQSYFPSSGDIIIPDTDHLAPNGSGSGKVPSDTYSLDVEHIFETSPIDRNRDDDGSGFFQSAKFTDGVIGKYYLDATVDSQSASTIIKDVEIQFCYVNPNTSTGIEFKGFSYKDKFPNNVKKIGSSVVEISIHNSDIRNLMQQNGLTTSISEQNKPNTNSNYTGTWLKCRWIVKLQVRPRSSGFFNFGGTGFKQGNTIKVKHSGFFKTRDGGGVWQNFFYPTFQDPSTFSSLQGDTFHFNGSKTIPPGGAIAPYWEFDTSGGSNISDTLIMTSEKVNEAYDNGLKQIDIPYSASRWPKFPRGIEPNFVQFPSVTETWRLELGDEIKFENNENLTYKINSITPPSENGGKLKITVQPPIENQTINKDFFVIRRFVEEKGTLILETPKPYIFPTSASTSPGLILPEFPIKEIGTDPDLIIKDLEDKKLIE